MSRPSSKDDLFYLNDKLVFFTVTPTKSPRGSNCRTSQELTELSMDDGDDSEFTQISRPEQ